MNLLRRFLAVTALLGALPLAIPAAAPWAAPALHGLVPVAMAADDKLPSRIQLSVLVVHATDSETGVDPRLASLASSFRYFKYKGYRLLSQQNSDLAVGGAANFSVEGGRKVKVTLMSMDDARCKLHVEMSNDEGKVLDTTVNINRDGTFIISGPKYKDGILMLPLRASCPRCEAAVAIGARSPGCLLSCLRDDLILIGWLSRVAPEACEHPAAGPCATAAVRAVFPPGRNGVDALDDALANALRRSLATVLLEQPRWVLHQPEVLDERQRFRAALDNPQPALLTLLGVVRSFPSLAAEAVPIAALWLPTFRVQAKDVLPHDDRAGLLAAIDAVKAIVALGPPSAQVGRELAGLHQRVGDSQAASALRGADDGQSVMELADQAAASGDMTRARDLLSRAQTLFARSGMLAGMAAVKRREAALLDPKDRPVVLYDAIRLSRDAGDDTRGEVEGWEDLSRAWSESGRTGAAVAALGRMAKLHRAAVEPLGEARALQLAGRLLCEAWGPDRDPAAGMVMLLWAADIGGSQDPVLADLTHRYIQGFQYTLSDAEFSAIEPVFDRPRHAVVSETFARYDQQHSEELP